MIISAQVLLSESVDHGFLVLAATMSLPPVVLYEPLDLSARLGMHARIRYCLFAFVARQFDTSQQAECLRIIERLIVQQKGEYEAGNINHCIGANVHSVTKR